MQLVTQLVRWQQTLHQASRKNSMKRQAEHIYAMYMGSDCSRTFLLWYLSVLQVIAALLQTMEDQGNQRVQAHAAAALINFTEDCPKSLLIPYLDNLVKHLHSTMVLKIQEVRLSAGGSCVFKIFVFTSL